MVSLPRWVLVTLAAALGVSLLLVAYLLGRQSQRGQEVNEPLPLRRPAVARPVPAATPARAPETAPEPTQEPAAWPTVGVARSAQPEAPTVSGQPPAPARRAARPEVDAYFSRIEQIQLSGVSASPEAAQTMLNAMLQGDSTSFDRLLADAERGEREARGITPPPQCAAYHAALLDLLRESRVLLVDLKGAIGAEDPSRLLALGARAAELQRKGEALKEQEQALRGA
jgi:hypothetical protein